MEDIQGAEIQGQYSRVIFKCKTGTCISTDWKENGKEEYTQEFLEVFKTFKEAIKQK